MKILYENEFRKVEEEDVDHIHLDDGTVIRNSEIIKLPFGINISKYSEKKEKKKILKGLYKILKKLDKALRIINDEK
jgi:hypothetical protein